MSTSIGVLSADFNSFSPLIFMLEQKGFRVINYSSLKVNIESLIHNLPRLLLLDLDIDGFDGIEICERIKEKKKNISIIICSNKTEEYIQIAAFKAGADDFVSKNISHRLLHRKINALLKQSSIENYNFENHSIHHLSIKINRESYLVNNGEKDISLQKKQFELLYLLVSNPKKVFTRDELYQAVWNKELSNPRIIDVHIRKLREQIGEDLIITIKGNGYKIAS